MALKNLLNKMGLVEDEVVAKKPVLTVTPMATPDPLPSQPVYSTWTPRTPIVQQVDPAIQEMLNQSLQENKLSGFDYLKFISSVDETKSTGVPEDARFKMTFSTAKQLGVDKAGLLKTGTHYLDVLAQDEAEFNSGCAQYEKSEVQARESKIANIDSTITDLNKQLLQLNQDRTTLAMELQQEKTKLEVKRTSFRVTLESIRATIKSNLNKIEQYLQ